MEDFSVLIGGKAGDGINRAGFVIGRILSRIGYRIYMYYDYPSLIRGGHNFTIVRASRHAGIASHHVSVDCILALDHATLLRHAGRRTPATITIVNSDSVKAENHAGGLAVPLDTITKEEGGIPIMANSCLIGAFCHATGIPWDVVGTVLDEEMPQETEKNIAIARRGFDAVPEQFILPKGEAPEVPLVTGNEAIGLGLLQAGLDAYVSYPMTPSSGILHYLAEVAGETSLKVIHPESEIAVMLMAQGFAFAGSRTAVGTSGGGFCLMTEGVSMAGMTEVPVTIVVSMRPGPSTGVPTYTAQGDLAFILSAGQGEFPRFVIAPADPAQAFEWSGRALNLSWKYQVPSFILVDKTLSEGTFSFDPEEPEWTGEEPIPRWDGTHPYHRYAEGEGGVSPFCPVPTTGVVVKVNSYAHDEDGITTEDPDRVVRLVEKRMKKSRGMQAEIDALDPVLVSGDPTAATAILCWGTTSGICREVGDIIGLRVVQPVVLSPFPAVALRDALAGVSRIISVEDNAGGQLASLAAAHGITISAQILRYDGRPHALEELRDRVMGVKA
ncbi:MAG: 2-oxoacid:acceptor oxidoreductase family protein [Methanomicrobiaceae archaeon]|nr:2-oxoacid:acceptor oxidoreductase family protein [Methanomicrobiaceae archaeon]